MNFLQLILGKLNLIVAITLVLQTFTPNQAEPFSLLLLRCFIYALWSEEFVRFVLPDTQYFLFYLFTLWSTDLLAVVVTALFFGSSFLDKGRVELFLCFLFIDLYLLLLVSESLEWEMCLAHVLAQRYKVNFRPDHLVNQVDRVLESASFFSHFK